MPSSHQKSNSNCSEPAALNSHSGQTLLRLFPILNSLEPAQQASLISRLVLREFERDELLYSKDEEENFIGFLLEGYVNKVLYGLNGREVITEQLGAGQLIGETALLDLGRRSTSATCGKRTQVLLLYRRDFYLLRQNIEFMHYIGQLLCQHLRQSTYLVESVTLHRLEARLARYLLQHTLTSHTQQTEMSTIKIPVNQTQLAAMVNVSRPKLNAQLQNWRRTGLVSWQHDSLCIHDLKRLKACASSY